MLNQHLTCFTLSTTVTSKSDTSQMSKSKTQKLNKEEEERPLALSLFLFRTVHHQGSAKSVSLTFLQRL